MRGGEGKGWAQTWSLRASLRDPWTASNLALMDSSDSSGDATAGATEGNDDDDDDDDGDDGSGRNASSTIFNAVTSRPTLLHHTAVLCLVCFILSACWSCALSPASRDA